MHSTAELDETGIADTDRAFNLTWHDWLNLKNLIAMSKVIAAAACSAKTPAARISARTSQARATFPRQRLQSSGSGMASCRSPTSRFSSRSLSPAESLLKGKDAAE